MSGPSLNAGSMRRVRLCAFTLMVIWTVANLTCWAWDQPFTGDNRLHLLPTALSHGLLWMLGLLGIGLATRWIQGGYRKQEAATTALCESEEYWQFALEGSGDGLWDWNVLTNSIYFSHQLKAMLGFKEHEIGNSLEEWNALVHPDDRERVDYEIGRHFADEIPLYLTEHRVKCKDGTYKWILDRGKVITRGPDGKPVRMIGTHHDITERKRVEEENQILGRLAIRLAAGTTVESIVEVVREETEALFQWDAHYFAIKDRVKDEYSIPFFVDTINGQKQKFPGSPWTIVKNSRVVGRLLAHEPLLSNRPSHPAESRQNRFGDISRPSACIMDAPVCSGDNVIGALSVQSYTPCRYDSTHLRTLQRVADIVAPALGRAYGREALLESEAVLRALLDVATDSMLLLDSDFRIITCNEIAANRLSRTRSELIGKCLLDLYPPDGARLREAKLREMIAARQPLRFAAEHNDRLFDHHILPVLDQNGDVYRSAFFAWDITELNEAAQRNSELAEQLRQSQKMQAIGQLAGGVAHNFNNLLLAVSGNTEAIADTLNKLPPTSSQGACLHSLAQLRLAVEVGTNLTRRLLTFCHKQVLHPVVFDPNEAIREMVEILRAVLGAGVELLMEEGENIGYIYADPRQIEESILNLALNGRDAMPDGGTLTIRTSRTVLNEDAATQLTVQPGPYVSISIGDTGVGMNQQTLSRLFEPFFTTKPLGQGAGLGLATVYGFVKQADGCIDVQSEPGKGTTFTMMLPAAEESAKPERHIAQASKPIDKTVLLCDDDAMIRELIVRYLGSKGYTVTATPDAETAMEVSSRQERPFDVLIADVQLAAMDGLELARRLKQQHSALACIIISGHRDYMPEDANGNGLDMTFLNKPFQFADLLQAVQGVVPHSA